MLASSSFGAMALCAENDFADRDEKIQLSDIQTDVRLRASILIKAKLSTVKSTVHEQKTLYKELDYAKVLSSDGTTTTTEQRFNVALLGPTTCTFRETDVSPNQIEYRLLKSDMFAVMDGRWVMTPTPDDKSTRLDLYCHAGVIKKVPRFLLKIGMSRSLRRHLDDIKKAAEEKRS